MKTVEFEIKTFKVVALCDECGERLDFVSWTISDNCMHQCPNGHREVLRHQYPYREERVRRPSTDAESL